jgi:ectoine hydroxylase-related dioxygenase (phytanoyl-CoA dioxygenase family)
MGVRSARLYHDQALFKEPGGTPTAWHQDQTYMPFETPHLIGLWVALVPVPLEVGSMSFVSESHKHGWFGKLPFSAEANEPVQKIVRERGLRYASYGTMEPGDATFHCSWTLHSAKGNPTPNVREIMNVFYLDGEARITEPMSSDHEIGLKYNLGASKVGEVPGEAHNPLVYRQP